MEIKILSHAELVNRIKQYLETEIPEKEYEILDHNLAAEEPTLGIQTCMRIIGIAVTPTGEVVSDYSVKLGLGNETDFENRAIAIKALRGVVERSYSDGENIKEDFMASTITLDHGDKHIVLTSDYSGKVTELVEARQIEEKPEEKVNTEKPRKKRVKKEASEDTDGQMSLSDFMGQPEIKEEEKVQKAKKTKKTEVEEKTEPEIKEEEFIISSKSYDNWEEGMKVRNVYNPAKIYTVTRDMGNIIKVKDDSAGSFNVARSDLEVVTEDEEI